MLRHDVKSVKRGVPARRACAILDRMIDALRRRRDMMRVAAAGVRALIALAVPGGMPAVAGETLHGSGIVTAVVAPARQVVIDAGDIPGYMVAMEMPFRVDRASLLDGLAAGDRIEFDIDATTHAIVRIRVIGAQK
jgi:Cu/Ag efflux protein CusF